MFDFIEDTFNIQGWKIQIQANTADLLIISPCPASARTVPNLAAFFPLLGHEVHLTPRRSDPVKLSPSAPILDDQFAPFTSQSLGLASESVEIRSLTFLLP